MKWNFVKNMTVFYVTEINMILLSILCCHSTTFSSRSEASKAE